MRLSIVGTVHAESGRASVFELQALLDRLKPEVIFAEIPSADVNEYCDGSRGSLESAAVARHREGNNISVLPVDLLEPDDAFFRDTEEMFAKVERTSPDYRRLMDENSLATRIDGFAYLNSDRCLHAWRGIYGEVLATLDWIRDPRLRESYDVWNEQIELRDTAMVRSIAAYATSHRPVHGVLLVGAAHRQSIINKARATTGTGIRSVDSEWDSLSLGRT